MHHMLAYKCLCIPPKLHGWMCDMRADTEHKHDNDNSYASMHSRPSANHHTKSSMSVNDLPQHLVNVERLDRRRHALYSNLGSHTSKPIMAHITTVLCTHNTGVKGALHAHMM